LVRRKLETSSKEISMKKLAALAALSLTLLVAPIGVAPAAAQAVNFGDLGAILLFGNLAGGLFGQRQAQAQQPVIVVQPSGQSAPTAAPVQSAPPQVIIVSPNGAGSLEAKPVN
jgi:hypothetical protein